MSSQPWFSSYPRNQGPNRLNDALAQSSVPSVDSVVIQKLTAGGSLVNAASVTVQELGFVPQDSKIGVSTALISVQPSAAGLVTAIFPAGTFQPQVASVGNSQLIYGLCWNDSVSQGFLGSLSIADNGSASFSGTATAGANGARIFTFLGPRVFKTA